MVLPSPIAVPPITLFVAPDSSRMPLSPLPSPAAPLAFVPIKLPSTSLLCESLSIRMPAPELPEMIFLSAAVVPPMRLLYEPFDHASFLPAIALEAIRYALDDCPSRHRMVSESNARRDEG